MGTRGLWLFWLVAGCFGSASVATPPAVGIIASVAEQSAPLSARLVAPTRLQRSGDAFVVVAGSTALATSLPATADGTWRLTHSRYVAMDALLEGALPVAGQLVDGAVVYASIHTSTDAVVRANEDQVELFYVLHDDTAPRSWRWATSPGDGTWRACDSGAELVDDTGHVRLHATRPIAFDSDGTLLAMSMRVEGDVLSYELVGASRIDWPVVVDPGFDIAYWEQRHDAFPLPLAGPAFVYDDARAETLLYGGASPDYDDETWTWDGERWERHRPTTRPPPLFGASAVFDPERGVVWMFGGFDGREARGELWQWDGEDWTSVVREPSPGPMALSAMAFDPVTRTVLLFGGLGVAGTEWLGATWRWDGASWSMLAPPTPEPRCAVACSMVFEPGGRALLVSTGGAFGTWGWDGAAWSRVDAAGTPLFAPQRLVVDEVGVLALSTLHPYGPSRARWEGSNWVPIEEPPTLASFRPMPSGDYDRLRRRPILYGGRNTAHNLIGDLMEHDGTRWRLVSPTATFSSSVPAPGVLPLEAGAPVLWDGERAFRWAGDRFSPTTAYGDLADVLAVTATTTGEAYDVRRRGTDLDVERWRAGAWTTIATLPMSAPAILTIAVHESSGVVVVASGTDLLRWDGEWQRDGSASSDGVRRLAYDLDDDVVLAVDSLGSTRVWSPTSGWTAAAAAGGQGLGVDADGSVVTVGPDGTFVWTSTGWSRAGDRGGPSIVTHDASGRSLLIDGSNGEIRELRAGRWTPTAQRTEVLDLPADPPSAATVSVDRDSGRTVTTRRRDTSVDFAWVHTPSVSAFDGDAWLPLVASSAYAGPGRGLLVVGGGSAWQWNTAGVDFVALPVDVDGFALVGYDRASASVLGRDRRGRTFAWDGATWSPGVGTLTGRSPAATDPATGALHILESGVLQRWASGWVTVDEHPEASGIGAHDARGTLVLFGSRDGVVTVHEGPPWVERDVRGELPTATPLNGAYHAPTDSVVTRRHTLRLLSGVGLPCADADDCGGGFCVDGVCCDDPCGGGALDCMACSVAEGAAMDGHCGPLAGGVAESVECRASTDPCDVAEHCSSGSPVCPGDAIVVDGTSCDDGLVCNGMEICVAGACTPGASACDDGDPCTSDACAEPDGCLHAPVAACCSMDVECDDGDACTADRCVDHACAHDASCPDAGTDAGSADAGTMRGGLSGGGCGCRAVAFRDGAGAIVWAALALGLCARRRLS